MRRQSWTEELRVSEQEPINRTALDDLLATTGGDPAFLAELIDTRLSAEELARVRSHA